jgi:hypothetical protein
MADSGFWRGLAEKFRALQETHETLRADWDYVVGSSGPGKWTLTGAGRTATIQFETLAKRGASALPHAGSSDLLIDWLEALRRASANFKLERDGCFEQNTDGSEVAYHQTGTIWRICEASADYCSELESHALEAEASLPKKSFATPLGRNLDRLRRESGWSFDEMAKATEIDKKLILGHVNKGKNARPGTLATYAYTFTEKLGRPVTVADLEG